MLVLSGVRPWISLERSRAQRNSAALGEQSDVLALGPGEEQCCVIVPSQLESFSEGCGIHICPAFLDLE